MGSGISAEGAIDYEPPAVNGKETDIEQFGRDLKAVAEAISMASEERDRAREERDSTDR